MPSQSFIPKLRPTKTKAKAKPTTIDEVLASATPQQRAALEKLRRTIKVAAPQANECISYGLAAFRLHGKSLVAFAAAKNHCAFYPMSSTIIPALASELAAYDTSKGTIRFSPDKPLPTSLVRKLVKAKIAEIGQGLSGKPNQRPGKPGRGTKRT